MIHPLPAALLVTLTSAGLSAQTATAPAFDAAAIKPSLDPPGSSGVATTNGRVHAANVTLKRLVRGAYGVQDPQILGGPKWFDEDRYYVDAKAPGPAGDDDLMVMLQSLLAERFNLVLHREHREFSGYALVLGKGGLKAKPSGPDAAGNTNSRRGGIDATDCTMAHLASKLSEVLYRPVVDSTGIEGKFDITLRWTTQDEMKASAPEADSAPSLFSAIQEQLGLRLESRKVPAEVLVIDRAEKPSDN